MSTQELLPVIYRYVEGEISLEQLEDWLVPRLPLLFRLPLSEPEATDLAAAVELGLADMSNQTQTEEEFRNMLISLLPEAGLSLVYPAQEPVTSSSQPPPSTSQPPPSTVTCRI